MSAQAAFALTGVVESKTIGSKVITVDFTAIKALPVEISADVTIDRDTQEMSCLQYLKFPNLAQALINMHGLRMQENIDGLVYLSSVKIEKSADCVATSVNDQNLMTVRFVNVLEPQIVVSQRHINDILTPTTLSLSGPPTFVSASLENVGPTHYVLKNIHLPTTFTMDFSVFESSEASVSYLEHGQIVLK